MPERDLYKQEYEIRCDAFIEEVNNKIVNKYPELDIEAINKTTENIISEASRIKEISSLIDDDEIKSRFVSSIKRSAHDSDVFSAHASFVTIDLWGWKKGLKEKMISASQEILDMSKQYLPNDCQISSESYDEIPYCIHITAIFS